MPFSHELDSIDTKILRELQTDARITVSDISKKTGIPHATIRLRIKKLENNGVIKGYSPILDFGKLGYGSKAIMLIKTSPEEGYDNITDALKKMDNVVWVYSVSGQTSGALMITAKNIHELHDLVLSIRRIPGVIDEETIIVMDEVKEGGAPSF